MLDNIYLQEATESSPVPTTVKAIKKLMNTCQLTKFKSMESCAKLYSAFFISPKAVSELKVNEELTVEDWSAIYVTLVNDNDFMSKFAMFIGMWHPVEYSDMFKPYQGAIIAGFATSGEKKLQYLGNVKSSVAIIQKNIMGACEVVKAQVNDPDTIKFITVIDQTLNTIIFSLNKEMEKVVAANSKPDDIHYDYLKAPLEEDAKDLLWIIENAEMYITGQKEMLQESIVNDAKEKIKEQNVRRKKAERNFDEFVMKKVRELRANRRNRKHAEMVGEALRINREIKKLLVAGGVYLVSPAVAVIGYLCSILYDRQTDYKDRAILLGQIKDELEIIEEKISMAERNGDDKAKVDLIRCRQKLLREYERINKVAYSPEARARH